MIIDIFEYSDYRLFFQDYFRDLKVNKPQLSQRCIALKANLDPSFFSKVIKGKRRLSFEQAMNLAKFLKFSKSQQEYLELLIRCDHSRSLYEKEIYQKKIQSSRQCNSITTDNKKCELYKKWYYTVINELIQILPTVDHELISRMVIPEISPTEVKHAIELLDAMKMAKKRSALPLGLSATLTNAESSIPEAVMNDFQQQMFDIAKEALKFNYNSKEVTTLTIRLSKEGFVKVKNLINGLKKELIEIVRNDTNVSGVYQINIQAFPVALLEKEPQ
jgi:uncharacterized protein (TIGR02147 family)